MGEHVINELNTSGPDTQIYFIKLKSSCALKLKLGGEREILFVVGFITTHHSSIGNGKCSKVELLWVEKVLYRYRKKIYQKSGETRIHNELQEWQYMTLEPSQGRRVVYLNSAFSPNIFFFFRQLNHYFFFSSLNMWLTQVCSESGRCRKGA